MGTVTDGGFTVSWAGVISGALWGVAGMIVALDLALWQGTAAGHVGNFIALVALAWTLMNGQRRCQKRIQVAVARQAERANLVGQLNATGPRKL